MFAFFDVSAFTYGTIVTTQGHIVNGMMENVRPERQGINSSLLRFLRRIYDDLPPLLKVGRLSMVADGV